MSRKLLLIFMLALLPLASCGVKGKLRSPSEIEAKKAKETRRQAKQSEQKQPAATQQKPQDAESGKEQVVPMQDEIAPEITPETSDAPASPADEEPVPFLGTPFRPGKPLMIPNGKAP
jgi:predicted small lipoprotein YifL